MIDIRYDTAQGTRPSPKKDRLGYKVIVDGMRK